MRFGKVWDSYSRDIKLMLTCVIAGIAVGLSVVFFHGILKAFENMITAFQTAELREFLPLVPIITALGGLSVGLLDHTIFKGITGEGFRGVVKAIAIENGIMRRRHTLKAIITSAFSISTGGGAGREAPTVIMGASLASAVGRLLKRDSDGLRILCGSGAAAAVSSVFNAPLGGIVFALEIIIGELDIRTLVYMVVTTICAMTVRIWLLGVEPILVVPYEISLQTQDYFLIPFVGILCGLVSVYFVQAFKITFRIVESMLKNFHPILKPAIGGLAAGSIVMFLPTMLETSYAPINNAIAGETSLWIAALTFLIKPISNAITLGSGGAGGSFAVALKVGAMFGFFCASVVGLVIPEINHGMYALICAGAVVAGAFYAPLTGIVLITGITQNYNIILPLLFCCAFSTYVIHKTGLQSFNPIQGGNLHV